MEFELVIERIEEGYLDGFEERILGFGEVVVVESIRNKGNMQIASGV